jgi:hypothetical protein|tara:strand:+ start:25 stop:717 length:693 start_codon:yes stop_codon:yes gene_type:complete
MPLPALFYALGSTVIRTGAVKAAKELLKKGFKKLANPTKTQQNNAVSIQSAAAKKILKNVPKASVKSNKGKNIAKVVGGVTGVGTAVKVGSDIAKEMSKDKIKDSGGKEDAKQKSMEKSYKRKGRDLGDKEPTSRKDSSLIDESAASKKRTKISDSGGREDAKERNKTRKLKAMEQGRRRSGRMMSDSTTKGMDLEDDPMRNNKGGAIKKTYGMKAGGFTKRGGMYKKGY